MKYPRKVNWRKVGMESARFVGACGVGAAFVLLMYYSWFIGQAMRGV